MRKFLLVVLIFVLALVSFLVLKQTNRKYTTNKIAVTLLPFYDIAQEIAGDKFEVILILPPGAEPHNYELKPEDLRRIQGAKLIFASGLIIDRWAENLAKVYPQTKVVYLAKDLELIDDDPHFWLSIKKMKIISEKISNELISLDPQNKDYYQNNLQKVLTKLDDLLNYAQTELKNISSRNLITQHNAFAYLAEELNLKIVGYLEGANKEITPSELKNLIDNINLYKIKVVFKEPGEESPLLKTIAQELNLKIYELDPLEGLGSTNYFEGYRKNIQILKDALK